MIEDEKIGNLRHAWDCMTEYDYAFINNHEMWMNMNIFVDEEE